MDKSRVAFTLPGGKPPRIVMCGIRGPGGSAPPTEVAAETAETAETDVGMQISRGNPGSESTVRVAFFKLNLADSNLCRVGWGVRGVG